MEVGSPSLGIKRLEGEVRQILRSIDARVLPSGQKEILANLGQALIDARKYASAYELGETREEQLTHAKAARSWLNKARHLILSASEHNIFSAIDVASLSAQIETVKENLE